MRISPKYSNSKAHKHTNPLREKHYTQPAITYSKLTIETLGQGVKYVQS